MRKALKPLAIAFSAFVTSAGWSIATSIPITNAHFDPPFNTVSACASTAHVTGAVAEGWLDNSCWADIDVNYSQDLGVSSPSAQRIAVSRIGAGYPMSEMTQVLTVTGGHWYRLTAWAKSNGGPASLRFAVHQVVDPWSALGSETYDLDTTWRQICVTAVIPIGDSNAAIKFFVSSVADVTVDAVSVQDLDSAVPGNLLPNSSFEVGISAGWTARIRGSNPFTDAALDNTGTGEPLVDSIGYDPPQSPKRSVKLVVPNRSTAIVSSPSVTLRPGSGYCASFWIKGQFAAGESSFYDTKVRITITGGDGNDTTAVPDVWLTPSPTQSWQRLFVCGSVKYVRDPRVWIRIENDAGVSNAPHDHTFWLDAAQLEEGLTPTAYARPWQYELAFATQRAGNIFFDTESAVVSVLVNPTLPAGTTIALTVTDLYGSSTSLGSVGPGTSTISIPPPSSNPRGMFKLTGQVINWNNVPVSPQVSLVYARLPHARSLTDPSQSYFGIHIPLHMTFVQIALNTGSRWVRLHDSSSMTKWPVVEQQQGHYSWFDAPITATRGAGMRILGMLDGAPTWASSQSSLTQYTRLHRLPNLYSAGIDVGIARWRNYVTKTVQHYKGAPKQIDAWEVWNEPWIRNQGEPICDGASPFAFFPCGTAAPSIPSSRCSSGQSGCYYSSLLSEAYTQAHATNSSVSIIGADTAVDLPGQDTGLDAWTSDVINNARQKYDAISFHEYNDSFFGGPNNRADDVYGHINALQSPEMKDQWATEGGPGGRLGSWYEPYSLGLTPRGQVSQIVRYEASMYAAGVKHFFLYTAFPDTNSGTRSFSALEHDKALRGVLAGRAVLASLIDTATGVSSTYSQETDLNTMTFGRSDGSQVWVLWKSSAGSSSLPLRSTDLIYDLLGNSVPSTTNLLVTPEPVYVVRTTP